MATVACDLSPDITCASNEICESENPGLACFKGHCLPKDWIAKAKILHEKQNHCKYCPKDGEKCLDISRNDKHCGSCDNACSNGRFCKDGRCRCFPHQVLCSDHCVELKSDPDNCGKCGHTCKENEYCSHGKCVDLPCEKQSPPLANCSRACVSLQNHHQHCGKCKNRCRSDQHCLKGKCRCIQSQKACGDEYVDIRVNWRHCGGCGKSCQANQVCSSGSCLPKCPPLTPNQCFGGCFALKTSLRHCGKCGNTCNQGQTCIDGKCQTPQEQNKEPISEPPEEADGGEGYPEPIQEHHEPFQEPVHEPIPEPTCIPKTEVCDGKDNDCDGKIDENLAPLECYSGAPGTAGKGNCKKGTRACVDGKWGECKGEVTPRKESCDRTDEDCDGKIDNGVVVECYGGDPRTVGVSHCKKGTKKCVLGAWGICENQSMPQKEVCDGKDNDCDGKIDNGVSKSCFTGPSSSQPGLGICKAGKALCVAGKWGPCTGEVTPQKEICDGKDNDCNGIEDSYTRPCYSGPSGTQGKGLCKGGSQTCNTGKWGPCTGVITPQKETCDGKDNDCDGQIDENVIKRCFHGPGTAGKGICKSGTTTCKGGKWGACVGQVVAKTEICDTVDNDCDGQTDEGCNCISNQKRACGKYTQGNCKQGQQICLSGKWGACSGQILPKPETCNNQDDDCDGSIDEALTKGCYSGPNGTEGKGRCKAGISTCKRGKWETCTGEVKPLSIELCNNVDDDCDGQIDETPPNPPACSKNQGVCKGLVKKCVKGAWKDCELSDYQQHSSLYQVKELRCDNQDNDCDGKADNFTISCYEDFFTKPGVGECKAGARYCSNGSYGVCVGQVRPKAETCNEKDDNCNGKVDEGCVITLAGVPNTDGYKDGPAKSALFYSPNGIIVDSKKTIFIVDSYNHVIRKINANGNVSTIAGTPKTSGHKDGPAKSALFYSPAGMTADSKGNLYAPDVHNNIVRKIDINGNVSTIAGTPKKSGYKDGPAKNALFYSPTGITIDSKGNLYVADFNHVIRKIDTSGNVSTIAGTPKTSGHKDGPAKNALFHSPDGIAIDNKGNLYVADTKNNVIRKIHTNGNISTIAGVPNKSGHQDGPAKSALFNSPYRIAVDSKGNVYVADTYNHVIRKIDTSGNVSTIAGTPKTPGHKDGPVKSALFSSPLGLAFDGKGNLYVTESGNNTIRKIILP